VTGTAHKHHRTVPTDIAQKSTSPSVGRGYRYSTSAATNSSNRYRYKKVHLHQWAEVTGTDQQHRTKVTGTPKYSDCEEEQAQNIFRWEQRLQVHTVHQQQRTGVKVTAYLHL
jgi:hypothetical protein